jgi:hypothetical protein
VGKRGAAIIEARGLSSAASAANAAIDHMRDWALGTNGEWVTMGVPSNGEYGIPKDVMFGYPVTCEGGKYKIVEGLPIDAFSQSCIDKTLAELTGRAGRRQAPAVTRRPPAYLMLPKPRGLADLQLAMPPPSTHAARVGRGAGVPLHALVETHGALREVRRWPRCRASSRSASG